MIQIQAILFDCDGVLLESERLGLMALAETVSRAGYPMDAQRAAEVFSGNSKEATLAWLDAQGLPAQSTFDAADECLFSMFDEHVPMMPGIEQVLAGAGLRYAVCSNASERRLRRSLYQTPLAAHFGRHIYSADHVAAAKPAPDMALLAMQRLGVAPSQALFIDDNVQGVRCAKAAGCLSVGFVGPSEHRPGHANTLRQAGADYVVHGMAQFHALLNQLTEMATAGA